MGWTVPIKWGYKTAMTAVVLNQQIRDNLIYLKGKPADKAVGVTSDNHSGSWTGIDEFVVTVDLDVISDIVFLFNFEWTHTSTSEFLAVDIYDTTDSVYLSSGTATPKTNGLGNYDAITLNTTNHISNMHIWQDVSVGEHTYQVRVLSSFVTATSRLNEALCYFAAWER